MGHRRRRRRHSAGREEPGLTSDATALAKIGHWTCICGDRPEVLVNGVARRPEWRDPDDAPLEIPFLVNATIFEDPGYALE